MFHSVPAAHMVVGTLWLRRWPYWRATACPATGFCALGSRAIAARAWLCRDDVAPRRKPHLAGTPGLWNERSGRLSRIFPFCKPIPKRRCSCPRHSVARAPRARLERWPSAERGNWPVFPLPLFLTTRVSQVPWSRPARDGQDRAGFRNSPLADHAVRLRDRPCARLTCSRASLAAHQSAHGRLRRQHREPHALSSEVWDSCEILPKEADSVRISATVGRPRAVGRRPDGATRC